MISASATPSTSAVRLGKQPPPTSADDIATNWVIGRIRFTVECEFKNPGFLNWTGGCTVNLDRGGS
jgi:hypothetical protein